METYATDELILNDITRARMHALEEWTADGDPYRQVILTKSYQTMSLHVLIDTQQATDTTQKLPTDETNNFQATVIIIKVSFFRQIYIFLRNFG